MLHIRRLLLLGQVCGLPALGTLRRPPDQTLFLGRVRTLVARFSQLVDTDQFSIVGDLEFKVRFSIEVDLNLVD